jgi:hypothetical protein
VAPCDHPDEYQGTTGQSLRLAQVVDYEPTEALLLEVAQAWVKLAR